MCDSCEMAEVAIDDLRQEVEQLRVQLAGCSVAALGWAQGEQDAKCGDYGWSQSFEDVKKLRARYDELLVLIQNIVDWIEDMVNFWPKQLECDELDALRARVRAASGRRHNRRR